MDERGIADGPSVLTGVGLLIEALKIKEKKMFVERIARVVSGLCGARTGWRDTDRVYDVEHGLKRLLGG